MTGWDLEQGALHPDVAFDGADPVVAYQLGADVIVTRPGGRAAYPCSGLAFPRLWAGGGRVWLAYRDPDNRGQLVSGSLLVDLGPAWGNDPICFGGGYVYCQSRNEIRQWPLNDAPVASVVPGSPVGTGLSHVDPAGRLVTVDQARRSVPGMTRPSFAGGYVVGEGPDGGAIAQSLDGRRRLVLWAGAVSMTPRLAVAGGQLLVAKWQPGRVMRLTEAEIVASAPVPVPPPHVPSPSPQPTPPPEPTPVPVTLPNYKEYVAQRCRDLGLRRIDGGNNDATRAHTFEILNQIASELRARDPGIGLLEKTSGNRWRDRSIDILTWLEPSGACHHFDVIGDAEGADGDPSPGWGYVGLINASRWKEPYAVTPAPVPTPVPVPPPAPVPTPTPTPTPVPLPPVPPACEFAPCDHTAINARLDRIEAALLALVGSSLKPRPVTLKGGWLGTITGEVGAPKA